MTSAFLFGRLFSLRELGNRFGLPTLKPKSLFQNIVALCFVAHLASAHAAREATRPLEFVKMYVRHLADTEAIRDEGEHEFKTSSDQDKLSSCVHTMTRHQLEITAEISEVRDVVLDKPVDFLPQDLSEYYGAELDIYKRLVDDCTTFLEGPKPRVDYGKIAAEMPQLRARLEYIDQAIFKMTPAVFAALVQMKENSHGGADHLNITTEEKNSLVREIEDDFGDKLKQKTQNWIVSSASVLLSYLAEKGYKASDEPWD